MSLPLLFCPRCHRRIEPPSWLKTAKIRTEKGITIKCGYCKRGEAHVEIPPPPETVSEGAARG